MVCMKLHLAYHIYVKPSRHESGDSEQSAFKAALWVKSVLTRWIKKTEQNKTKNNTSHIHPIDHRWNEI